MDSANPDLVRRIAAVGHLVINHTESHRSWTGRADKGRGLNVEERVAELDQADMVRPRLTGTSARPWFRAPYCVDPEALARLAASGYTYNAPWTFNSLGSQGLSSSQIASRVNSQPRRARSS